MVAAYQQAFDNSDPGQVVSFDNDEDQTELRAKGEPLMSAFIATQLSVFVPSLIRLCT